MVPQDVVAHAQQQQITPENSVMQEIEVNSAVNFILPDQNRTVAEDLIQDNTWAKSQGGAYLAREGGGENTKPPHTYSQLIAHALRDCGGYATLSQIYKVRLESISLFTR